jgi:hypothetical protein
VVEESLTADCNTDRPSWSSLGCVLKIKVEDEAEDRGEFLPPPRERPNAAAVTPSTFLVRGSWEERAAGDMT